jgi:hypothetical protein
MSSMSGEEAPAVGERHIPLEELIFQAELRICNDMGITAFQCPCRVCHGGTRYTVQVIHDHLREHRRDPFLMRNMVGPDPPAGWPAQGIWVDDREEPASHSNDTNSTDLNSEQGDHLDAYHDIQQQIFDAFDTGDRMREGSCNSIDRAAIDEELEESMEKLDEMYRQASQPVYAGKSVSIISAVIVIINMAVIHGVNNTYVDELLSYLSTVLLPTGNQLPSTHYEAKKLIRKLGMNYDIIHACPDGCVLFRGEYKDLRNCPVSTCRKSRYIPGSDVIPAKVIRHFPLIPRLLQIPCTSRTTEIP